MTSPLLGVGLAVVMLGVLVTMFSRRQGAKLIGVGAAAVLLGWLNPATDLLPIFGVFALILGVVPVKRATALGLLAILLAVAIGYGWIIGVSLPPALDAAWCGARADHRVRQQHRPATSRQSSTGSDGGAASSAGGRETPMLHA